MDLLTANRGLSGGPNARFANWGRSVVSHPRALHQPGSVDELAATVTAAAQAGESIRAVGAGHSFSPVAATDSHMVNLDRMTGVVAVDRTTRRVRFRAGTRLRDIPHLLAPYGLALANQGDIDAQSIAGALSTGTHGTGLAFTGFAGMVTALQLLTADGVLHELSPAQHPELFDLARLSVGALGILTEVELACVDAFDLVADEALVQFDDVLDTFEQRSREHDHVDFYWFPHSDHALVKTNTRVAHGEPGDFPDVQPRSGLFQTLAEEVIDNGGLLLVCEIGRLAPALTPPINRVAAALASNRRYRAPAHQVFVSPRRVRFTEMEYAVPLSDSAEVLREVRRVIDSSGRKVSFPLEMRAASADDVPLSTAWGRESAYIAVHQYHRVEEAGYFRTVERILQAADGRPHWGKIHSLGAAQLRELYPRFDDFVAMRRTLDPAGVFGSRYLTHLFGS